MELIKSATKLLELTRKSEELKEELLSQLENMQDRPEFRSACLALELVPNQENVFKLLRAYVLIQKALHQTSELQSGVCTDSSGRYRVRLSTGGLGLPKDSYEMGYYDDPQIANAVCIAAKAVKDIFTQDTGVQINNRDRPENLNGVHPDVKQSHYSVLPSLFFDTKTAQWKTSEGEVIDLTKIIDELHI